MNRGNIQGAHLPLVAKSHMSLMQGNLAVLKQHMFSYKKPFLDMWLADESDYNMKESTSSQIRKIAPLKFITYSKDSRRKNTDLKRL